MDDHPLVREGIKRILDVPPGSAVIEEAGRPEEALRRVSETDWDIVILDLSLGVSTGLEVLKEMKRLRQSLPVLILTIHPEDHYARRAFKSGASGYLTKDCAPAELAQAVNKIMDGRPYVNQSMAEILIDDLASDSRPLHEQLSGRELQVMVLIASGSTINQISNLLSLSAKTVSTYRARILKKMMMKTNAEVIHYAITKNLV